MTSQKDIDPEDPRINRKTIDARVKGLVEVLNLLPNIRTIESCGGHKKPGDRLNPVPYGQFRVAFITPLDTPDDIMQPIISVITEGIREAGGKATLEKDTFPPANNCRIWSLWSEDKETSPDVLAYLIFSRAQKRGIV